MPRSVCKMNFPVRPQLLHDRPHLLPVAHDEVPPPGAVQLGGEHRARRIGVSAGCFSRLGWGKYTTIEKILKYNCTPSTFYKGWLIKGDFLELVKMRKILLHLPGLLQVQKGS